MVSVTCQFDRTSNHVGDIPPGEPQRAYVDQDNGSGKNPTESKQYHFLGLSPELYRKGMLTEHIVLLVPIGAMLPAASISCCLDFPATMDCTFKL